MDYGMFAKSTVLANLEASSLAVLSRHRWLCLIVLLLVLSTTWCHPGSMEDEPLLQTMCTLEAR